METCITALVQQFHPLDRPYVSYRTAEDEYYATYGTYGLPGWLTSLIAAIRALRQKKVPTTHASTIHVTQMA